MNENPQLKTNNLPPTNKPKKPKKYWVNILIIFLVAFGFTGLTLLNEDNLAAVIEAFANANVWVLVLIFGVFLIVILIESTTLYIMARLYTTRYSIPKAATNFFVGMFFTHITPSGTGGQFAQAYAFKRQGIDIANAASILVMHFLLSQIAQVIFGVIALFARIERFSDLINKVNIGGLEFPMIYISFLGFFINFLIIFGIILLAKSKFVHDKIINGIVTLLGKLKILKKPDQVKANLQVQIENFRIEIKRLQANTAVTIVLMILFFIRLFLSNSFPYLAAMAFANINLAGSNIFDGIFMTAYLNVIIYYVPTPGAVGFSEFFFSYLFQNIFGGYANTIAPQLIWRGITFYLTLFIGAAAVIKEGIGKRQNQEEQASFVEIQKQTIELRRQTAEIMFHTGELSTYNIQSRVSKFAKDLFGFKRRKVDQKGNIIDTTEIEKQKKKDKKS
jgi:uncharacterized protein (TIRG00374 family)